MILWTSGLALGLGALVVATMLEPVGDVRPENVQQAPALRGPASEGAAPYSTLALDQGNAIQAVDFNVPCASDSKTTTTVFASSVKQLRLSGGVCAPKTELSSSTIENESNGFSATVFVPSPRSFTTDYISLASGPNRLRIKHVYKDGKTEERELIIERAPASTQKE